MNVGDVCISNGEPYHRLIVAADCPHDNVLVVRITKPDRGKETTCWIYKVEYPSLAYDSLIMYRDAIVGSRLAMIDAEVHGDFRSVEPLPAAVVARICAGLPFSRAQRRVKRFLTEECCP